MIPNNRFLTSLVSEDSIPDMNIATEASYGEVLTFLKNPDDYLDNNWARDKYQEGLIYTERLRSDGSITCSIKKMGSELLKVNAYTEAIAIYSSFLDHLKRIQAEVAKVDKDNIRSTIDDIQACILKAVTAREEYTSNRKSILSRFDSVLKEIHKRDKVE